MSVAQGGGEVKTSLRESWRWASRANQFDSLPDAAARLGSERSHTWCVGCIRMNVVQATPPELVGPDGVGAADELDDGGGAGRARSPPARQASLVILMGMAGTCDSTQLRERTGRRGLAL
jgi:hypothetical protein